MKQRGKQLRAETERKTRLYQWYELEITNFHLRHRAWMNTDDLVRPQVWGQVLGRIEEALNERTR